MEATISVYKLMASFLVGISFSSSEGLPDLTCTSFIYWKKCKHGKSIPQIMGMYEFLWDIYAQDN